MKNCNVVCRGFCLIIPRKIYKFSLWHGEALGNRGYSHSHPAASSTTLAACRPIQAGRLRADGRCLLSLLFFELIQFIVIRFSIDCIVQWGSETRLMESQGTVRDAPPSHRLDISHVINLSAPVLHPIFFYSLGFSI